MIGGLGGAAVVVKHGPRPALLVQSGRPSVEVPGLVIDEVRDTTGAGDAFAAGLLLALADGGELAAATAHGHEVAAAFLRGR